MEGIKGESHFQEANKGLESAEFNQLLAQIREFYLTINGALYSEISFRVFANLVVLCSIRANEEQELLLTEYLKECFVSNPLAERDCDFVFNLSFSEDAQASKVYSLHFLLSQVVILRIPFRNLPSFVNFVKAVSRLSTEKPIYTFRKIEITDLSEERTLDQLNSELKLLANLAPFIQTRWFEIKGFSEVSEVYLSVRDLLIGTVSLSS